MLDLVEEATQKKELAFKKLSKVKKNTFNGDEIIENNEPVSIDRISDFGKFEEYLKTDYENFEKFYKDLKFLKKFDATLEGFSYNSPTIDIKTPKSNNEYKIVFFGKMLNRNGDIEQLFSSFDALTAEVKNNFANHKVKYVELPRDIDFAKKYKKVLLLTCSNRGEEISKEETPKSTILTLNGLFKFTNILAGFKSL